MGYFGGSYLESERVLITADQDDADEVWETWNDLLAADLKELREDEFWDGMNFEDDEE